MINVDFIENKLVPALRSGEYTQGCNVLRSPDNEYCCLGVATDVAIKEGLVDLAWGTSSINAINNYLGIPTSNYDAVTNVHGITLLDATMKEFLGFYDFGGTVLDADGHPYHYKPSYTMLWQLNDEGYTFAEIADFLEAMCAWARMSGYVQTLEEVTS